MRLVINRPFFFVSSIWNYFFHHNFTSKMFDLSQTKPYKKISFWSEFETGEMKDDPSINKLSKASWLMIANAMLVDASTWAFPSYNIVIWVFAKIVVFNASSDVPNRQKNLILLTSIFSLTTVMSIMFDAIYCICWGGEVRNAGMFGLMPYVLYFPRFKTQLQHLALSDICWRQ